MRYLFIAMLSFRTLSKRVEPGAPKKERTAITISLIESDFEVNTTEASRSNYVCCLVECDQTLASCSDTVSDHQLQMLQCACKIKFKCNMNKFSELSASSGTIKAPRPGWVLVRLSLATTMVTDKRQGAVVCVPFSEHTLSCFWPR